MLERRGQCVGRQMAALLINGHFKHLSGQIYHTVLDWCAQYHPDHKIIVILSINKQNIDLFCRVRQKRWCVGSGSANIIITDTSNISTTFTTSNSSNLSSHWEERKHSVLCWVFVAQFDSGLDIVIHYEGLKCFLYLD